MKKIKMNPFIALSVLAIAVVGMVVIVVLSDVVSKEIGKIEGLIIFGLMFPYVLIVTYLIANLFEDEND
jgi:choline-glycine betaine transporter